MIIATTDIMPGKKIIEYCGYCKGSTVRSKHIGSDIGASFKTIVGGEIKGYTEMMDEARQIAVGRMVEDAKSMNANAIVGFRLSSAAVMSGACEIIAYGTAVRIQE